MKKLVYLMALLLVIGFSCKKKQEPAPEPNPEQPGPAPEQPAPSPETPQAQGPSGPWMFEMAVVKAEGKAATVVTYVDGRNRRMDQYEGVGKDRKLQAITISTPEGLWVLTAESKTGMKMPPDENASQQSEAPPAMAKWTDLANTVGKTPEAKMMERGTESWEGATYKVYRITPSLNKNYIEYYIDSNDQVKRVVSYDETGKMAEDARMELKLGSLPPDAFTVPAGYQITEMGKTQ